MGKVEIAGLKIDAITKFDLLSQILSRVKNNQKTFITTPYSEFLYRSLLDNSLLEFLNKADFAVPDGIGIFWARRFLDLPLTAKNYWLKILQALWQIKYSLAAILFCRRWIMSSFAEKIPGSELVWDLAKLAADNNLSIYLLGGFGNTPELAANKLISQSANKLKIAGFSNKNPNDQTIADDINRVHPDLLFVAYGPIKQEAWIARNLPILNVKLAIGLGGTFDYLAGKAPQPPKFLRSIGLEWLWRLLTQPRRIKRIWQATFGLTNKLWHYKVFMSFPYRPNAISVVLNEQNQILIGKRNPDNPDDKKFGWQKTEMFDYWQFPQGGIDKNETIEQTAARECKEEIGVSNIKIINISNHKHTYLFPNALRPFLIKQSQYKGQEQSIVYIKTFDQIKIDNLEFINYKWVSADELTEQVHWHRKEVAKIIQTDLKKMQEKGIL